ncbi:spherulation-specific family 4 protein [Streptomyces sp. NPDC005474]|uniref:spherulation-specific family 4 protein n=1 Tax=Streptomyces sp. NPDC005474 TaxID=3154878 RepID=UPI00345419E7
MIALTLIATLFGYIGGSAQPAAAVDLWLNDTSLITNNLQGYSSKGDAGSKWTTSVEQFINAAPIVLLQEVGPGGPPRAGDGTLHQTENGDYREYTWTVGGSFRGFDTHVYYTQTQGDATSENPSGRVNIAIVTRDVPDEVFIVNSSTERGRNALGVRFGNNWYFTFHGLARSRGSDDGPMLNDIDLEVQAHRGQGQTWTVGGDFNVDPAILAQRSNFPRGPHIHASGQATHISGHELDYFVSTEPTVARPPWVRNGATPDHFAVQLGPLRSPVRGTPVPSARVGSFLGPTATGSARISDLLRGIGEGSPYLSNGLKRDAGLEFVGPQSAGEGLNYSGLPGEDASQLTKRSETETSQYKPNIVLVYAGMNDVLKGEQDAVPDRLSALADQVHTASPSTVVALATLTPATDSGVQGRITAVNSAVRNLVAAKQQAGQKVVLADTFAVTTADLDTDGITPNAAGMAKVAMAFVAAMADTLVREWVVEPSAPGGPATNDGQQIAIAAYTHPKADPNAWDRMIAASSSKATMLVANVLNGPGSTKVDEWADVINRAHASGKRVLGYVDTGYLGLADHRLTRLGSPKVTSWVAQIDQDVDTWYRLYGASIDGIFFDDGFNACTANNDDVPSWYSEVNDYAKRQHPGALTVLNPGTVVPQCYEDTADILLTYEGSYKGYFGQESNPELNHKDLGWTPKSPKKIWDIIYDVPADQIQRVADTAKSRGVGYVEITDDVMPNPYDQQPSADYLTAEQNAVSGGTPAVASPRPFTSGGGGAGGAPSLHVNKSDYTSASLSWPAVSGAARYLVRVDNQVVAAIPAKVTETTIGGLAPGGKSYTIDVLAQGADGTNSAPSNSVGVTTLSLPGGKPITNVKVTSTADSTTVSADFLVPYSFHRIYFWKWASDDTILYYNLPPDWKSCWPVNINTANWVCAPAMMENSTYLNYAGTNANQPDWTWSPVKYTPPTISDDGYTWTWTLPVGTSTLATNQFIIQGEGYSPRTNVFGPCSSRYLQLGGGPDKSQGNFCADS